MRNKWEKYGFDKERLVQGDGRMVGVVDRSFDSWLALVYYTDSPSQCQSLGFYVTMDAGKRAVEAALKAKEADSDA